MAESELNPRGLKSSNIYTVQILGSKRSWALLHQGAKLTGKIHSQGSCWELTQHAWMQCPFEQHSIFRLERNMITMQCFANLLWLKCLEQLRRVGEYLRVSEGQEVTAEPVKPMQIAELPCG